MKKKLQKEIKIPEDLDVKMEDSVLVVKGALGEVRKKFNLGKLVFDLKDDKVFIGHEKATKVEKKLMNTIAAHVENMFKGVSEKFEYKLKICSSHFPMSVKLNGNEVVISNFFGNKEDRKFKVQEGVDVDINKEIITVSSVDKELAGQVAANFEGATRIKKRDKRVFQDGIYITSKCGKEI